MLWSLLLWRYSRPVWTRSSTACCRWPCFCRRVGLDDPQRSFPTPNILWFSDSVMSSQASEWSLINIGGMTSSVSFISSLEGTTFFLVYIQPHSLVNTMEPLCARRQTLLLRSLAFLWKANSCWVQRWELQHRYHKHFDSRNSAIQQAIIVVLLPCVRGKKKCKIRYKWESIRYLKCN